MNILKRKMIKVRDSVVIHLKAHTITMAHITQVN
jgi:hypothetical protein